MWPTPPALALLMAGDPEAAEWFRRAAACWRESWDAGGGESWGRPIGALKASLLAGDERGGRGARALDARARRGGRRVADRPLRRRRSRCSSLGRWPRRAPRRRVAARARRLPARRRRRARVHRRARRRRLRRGGRVGGRVVRDAERVPRGRARRRHGARARRARAPPRASSSTLPRLARRRCRG